MRPAPALTAVLLLSASQVLAQNRGAQLTKQPKPVYPEDMSKGLRQGNVLLTGRIDTHGKIQDLKVVATSHEKFAEPAMAAVRSWEFRPATRDGKPVDIAANIGVRFRLESDKRGEIPRPTLGDLAVFPADAAGNRSGPEGFPIKKGSDPRLRAEAVLDVSPQEKPRTLTVVAQAVSPGHRTVKLYEGSVVVPAKAKEVKIPISAKIEPDWEDGVWLLRFTVDKAEAGGGQFWLARDPARFDFAAALARR